MVRRRHPAAFVLVASLLALGGLGWAVGSPASAAAPTWFDLATPDSFPQGLAAGPDGTTWIANRASAEIDRIDPAGAHATIALEFGVDPFDIVRGPDGAMWFTENNGSRIGRLTVDGELTEYYLRDFSTPTGITVGPDGALWFSQRGISSIGRITVDGELTEWPTLTRRAAPLGITTGSDGALWFTLTSVNAIGRITVDGEMTEMPLPGAAHSPQWITTGPDGALWFTARATNTIGRLTVGGGLTEYPVPTASAGLNGITTGPDGAIWFTEGTADAVGRLELGGTIAEIPLGEGASPTGIATGADGAIWFSAPGTNRVGRLDTVVEAPDVTAPTISIVSPPDGSVLTAGEGMLANYGCEDEPGGSGLTKCDGPVANQTIVPNAVGAHTFTVTAEDAAHNVATASHTYVVFAGVGGPITNQVVFQAGRTIPIQLELGSRPAGPLFQNGYPRVRQVHCATHEPIGPEAPADVQTSLGGNGRLQLLWRTGAGWGTSCRSLIVRFGLNGWTNADAVFTLRFG